MSGERLVVDPAELRGIATKLDEIRAELDDPSGGWLDEPAYGSPEVADAVQHFLTHWSKGRSELVEELQFVSSVLHQAASLYSQADEGLRAAIRPPSGNGGGAW